MNKFNFEAKAREIHGDAYDYSLVTYTKAKDKVPLKCIFHDIIFEITLDKHVYSKQGCKLCGFIRISQIKTMTIVQIIMLAQIKHNNKYDYSNSSRNGNILMNILCHSHGEFNQAIYNHLDGKGCKKCANDKLSLMKRDTLEEFIEKARAVHGDKYDYTKVVYVNQHVKVSIICDRHGVFIQLPCNHINNGQGCDKCGYEIIAFKLRYSTEEFIEKANIVHKNYYDYSLTIYGSGCNEFVIIICPKHGRFEQKAANHLGGSGCYNCAYLSISMKNSKSNEDFIKEASIIHNYKYDYSNTQYTKYHEPIFFKCEDHGDIELLASSHLRGSGCSKCSNSGYSKIACEWLTEIENENNIYIQHALNEGEKKIGPYWVDGFCQATNTIYEFHGCFFHGCLKCKNPNDVNSLIGVTMEELYIKTKNREEWLKNEGYTLVTMWECDYKLTLKNKK